MEQVERNSQDFALPPLRRKATGNTCDAAKVAPPLLTAFFYGCIAGATVDADGGHITTSPFANLADGIVADLTRGLWLVGCRRSHHLPWRPDGGSTLTGVAGLRALGYACDFSAFAVGAGKCFLQDGVNMSRRRKVWHPSTA